MATKKKKVAAKKVTKKAVRRSAPKRKKAAPKQRGETTIIVDKKRQAKPVGKRKSESGRVYYETRANRSDKGQLLGVPHKSFASLPSKITLSLIVEELNSIDLYLMKSSAHLRSKISAKEKAEIRASISLAKKQQKALRVYLNTRAKFV